MKLFVLDTLYFNCDKFVWLQKPSFWLLIIQKFCVHFYCGIQTHNYNQANQATISIQSGQSAYNQALRYVRIVIVLCSWTLLVFVQCAAHTGSVQPKLPCEWGKFLHGTHTLGGLLRVWTFHSAAFICSAQQWTTPPEHCSMLWKKVCRFSSNV